MWVGLLLAFGRESLTALNHYFPSVPVIPASFGDCNCCCEDQSVFLSI